MKHKFKRGLSLLLSCALILTLLPATALAASRLKPTTYYDVYVYARFYDSSNPSKELTVAELEKLGYNGLTLNEHGWFTYGKINNATTQNPTNRNANINQVKSDAVDKLNGNQFERYTDNQNIVIPANSDGVTYQVVASSGADNYVATGTTWHLNISINVNTLSSYTVHYYKQGTSEKVADDKAGTGVIGSTITETAVTVDGYTVDSNEKSIEIETENNEITFYYTPNKYTVSYTWSGAPEDDNAPTLPESQQVSYKGSHTVDSTFNSSTVIEAHDEYGNVNGKWTFSGWNQSGTITVTDNVEISGSWTYTPVNVSTHTVSYNWGTENVPSSVTKPVNATVPNNASYTVAAANGPVTTEDGTYTFDGWYSDENMTNQVTELQSVTQDVTLYGQWTFVPSTYTVTYNKGEHGSLAGQDDDGNVICEPQQKDTATPDAPVVTADDGYYFTGWSPDRTETVTGNVTYTAQYAVQTEIVLSVADRTVVYDRAEQTGETEVMVADGYTLKTGHTLSVTGTGYTPAQGTNVGQYEGSFDNAVVKIVDEEGNDVTEQYKIISKTAGKLTITKKAITIHVAGNTDTVEYTGEEQFVFGFEPVATDVPPDTKVELYVGTKAYASGTDVGQYNMGLVATDFKLTGKAADNYEAKFEVSDGWLKIYQSDALTVSVTPIDVIYDGQPHAVEYAVTINGEPVEDADVTVTYSWGDDTFDVPVDAGYYTATVTATKDNYETATGSATVTIRQREITVTADSASKTYDGTPLTKNSWTITSGTLVEGHKATVTITGSQTDVGSSNNVPSGAKITDGASNDVTANYSVTYVNGTLTVTKANKPYIPPCTPPYTPPVTPVQPSKPALNTEDHVAYIIGTDEGLVKPMANITRAEVATIFFRLLTNESRAYYWSTTNPYPDVDEDDWFNNAVSTLTNAGILTGLPDGAFAPYQYITRAEFATIAARFSDVAFNGKCPFPDVSADFWAYEYIGLAYELGWVEGIPDESGVLIFAPYQYITRAETCTIVNRVLERQPHEDHLLDEETMITWPDNVKGTWYYEQMQEATNSHDYVWTTEEDGTVEDWTAKLEERDWAALERAWSTAYSAPGSEVVN